jgi:hypothetical protein
MQTLSNLRARLVSTRVKHLLGPPLLGSPQASPPNIRQGWKGLLGTRVSAYWEHS